MCSRGEQSFLPVCPDCGVFKHLCVVVLIGFSSFYVLLMCVVSDDCAGLSLAVGSQLLLDPLKPAALTFCFFS